MSTAGRYARRTGTQGPMKRSKAKTGRNSQKDMDELPSQEGASKPCRMTLWWGMINTILELLTMTINMPGVERLLNVATRASVFMVRFLVLIGQPMGYSREARARKGYFFYL